MMKKGIMIHLLALVFLIGSMAVIPVSANTVNMGPASLQPGYTMVWYPSYDTNGYPVAANTTVQLYFKLGSAETNVFYGMENGFDSNDKTQFAQFSGTNNSSSSKKISVGGTYKPYITNYTANYISIEGTSNMQY